jgi:hypothetical protein
MKHLQQAKWEKVADKKPSLSLLFQKEDAPPPPPPSIFSSHHLLREENRARSAVRVALSAVDLLHTERNDSSTSVHSQDAAAGRGRDPGVREDAPPLPEHLELRGFAPLRSLYEVSSAATCFIIYEIHTRTSLFVMYVMCMWYLYIAVLLCWRPETLLC